MYTAKAFPRSAKGMVKLLNEMEAEGWRYVETFGPNPNRPNQNRQCLFVRDGVAPEKPKAVEPVAAPELDPDTIIEDKKPEAPKAEAAPKTTSAKSAPGKRKTRKAKA